MKCLSPYPYAALIRTYRKLNNFNVLGGEEMKKILSIVSLFLAALLLFTACSSGTQSTPSASAASTTAAAGTTSSAPQSTGGSGGTLKIGEYILDTQMANKNPFMKSGVWTGLFTFVYEPLLYFDPVNGKLMPALADSYTWSSDFKTLTLKLNTKVKWQDGQPFTADDVVFTYNCLIKYPVLDTYGIGKNIDTVTANGDSVVFNLKNPFTAMANYISTVYIVPKHLWDGKDPSTNINETPVGTGPFKFIKYNTGTDVQFDANKDYWRGAPKVDKLIVQMYNSAPNVTLALLKGEITGTMGTLAMANIPEFLSKPGAKLQKYGGLTNFSVIINNEKPLLNDVNVRKAMAMAVNQGDLIAKGEYNGVSPTSIGWLPDIFGEFVNTQVKDSLKFDLAAANKVLTDAGYSKGKDGIYQKDGKRLSFTYYNASGAPAQQMEAGMIQQWLLNLGIEIIPKLATWPELTKLCQQGNFDLLQNGIAFPPDPYAALNVSFNSAMTAPTGTATPGTNYFRFRNSEVDSLLASAASATDPAKQKEVYGTIQEKIAAQYPFLPMYNVGGHVPYYDSEFTGWSSDAPIWDPVSIINVHKK